jgi:hypothetical protein
MKALRVVVVFSLAAFLGSAGAETGEAPPWRMKATIIEACSCPMFCQCYFNDHPAEHHHGNGEGHYCRFNNAYRVDEGRYGDVVLDGAKFWIAGDLGEEFKSWKGSWNVITFDRATTQKQRDAIQAIVAHLYPVKWGSSKTAVGEIAWQAGKGEAHALLDGGKAAEVKLRSASGANTAGEPVVIHNLEYWSAPRNDGFVLMPNEVQAYRAGDKSFETKGTNGFMITFEIDSESVKKAGGGGM